MKLLNGILYLQVADWTKAGLYKFYPSDVVRRGLSTMTVVPDPEDGRAILIEWSSIKNPKHRQAIIDTFGEPEQFFQHGRLRAMLPAADSFNSFYRDFRKASGERLTASQVEQYTLAARWLSFLAGMDSKAKIKAKAGYNQASEFWNAVIELIDKDQVRLPKSYRKLILKVQAYRSEGMTCIIDGRNDNTSARKIDDMVSNWLVGQMAASHLGSAAVAAAYDKSRAQLGLPQLSSRAIQFHLESPEIKQIWYRQRHGDKAYFQKYGYTHRMRRPAFSNDMWTGDGTMLNLYYFDPESKQKFSTLNVYVVADALSETFLGYSLTEGAENFALQLEAYRMAMRQSECKPYQVIYDNQKGHKTGEAKRFYDRLASVHFPSQAYRAQGKPIEGMFGRFQRQHLAELWFWTGFGRHTHARQSSSPNRDYVSKHVEDLPTKEELIELVASFINDWNAARHPIYRKMSRLEVYEKHRNPEAKPASWDEMAELFWNVSAHAYIYRKEGLTMTINGEKLTFEVYDADGNVDFEFRRKWLGAKFLVKYDPQDSQRIMLYEPLQDDMRYVAVAEQKRAVQRSIIGQSGEEKSWIQRNLAAEKENLAILQEQLEEKGFDEAMSRVAWRKRLSGHKEEAKAVTIQDDDDDFNPRQIVLNNM